MIFFQEVKAEAQTLSRNCDTEKLHGIKEMLLAKQILFI